MSYTQELKPIRILRDICIGWAIGSFIGYGIVSIREKKHSNSIDTKFHVIPAVQALDSIYKSQTNAYQLQLDSLRKVYAPTLENKLGDSK